MSVSRIRIYTFYSRNAAFISYQSDKVIVRICFLVTDEDGAADISSRSKDKDGRHGRERDEMELL